MPPKTSSYPQRKISEKQRTFFVLRSFHLRGHLKCILSMCVSLCVRVGLLLQLPKSFSNINLKNTSLSFLSVRSEEPHDCFIKCSQWETLVSVHSLFILTFITLCNCIGYATLKSGDQIKRCYLAVGNIFSNVMYMENNDFLLLASMSFVATMKLSWLLSVHTEGF